MMEVLRKIVGWIVVLIGIVWFMAAVVYWVMPKEINKRKEFDCRAEDKMSEIVHMQYKGHWYIWMRGDGDMVQCAGLVHDPDCECRKVAEK